MFTNRKISKELLEETIAKAEAMLQKKSVETPLIRRKSLSGINNIIQNIEYDANLISSASNQQAKLFAAAGPKFKNLQLFFHEVICNPIYPVTRIIAFGSQLGYSDKDAQDFHDYCLLKRKTQRYQTAGDFYEVTCKNNPTEEGAFTVTSKQYDQAGNVVGGKKCMVTGIQHSTLTVDHGYLSSTNLTPGVFKKEEEIKDSREVKVTVIAYKDCLKIKKDQVASFWELYKEIQQQNTVIHDSDGQAGQFILMLEMVRNFNKIFYPEPDPTSTPEPVTRSEKAATVIMQILTDMCSDRKALVPTAVQLEHAIRGATLMMQYQFSLESVAEIKPIKPVRSLSAPVSGASYGRFCFTGYTNSVVKEAEQQVLALPLRMDSKM